MSLTKSQTNIAAMLAKAGRKVSVIDASDPRKAPIVQEFNHKPAMSMEDELANLRAENMALVERLRGSPEMREVISELKKIHVYLAGNWNTRRKAVMQLEDLLRRLDESQ